MAADYTYNILSPFMAPGTVTPATGAYISRSDIEQIFGVPNIIKWAILSGADPTQSTGQTEITARVNWSIGAAEAMFHNAMREGMYILPLTGPDAVQWAKLVCATLAGNLLYQHLKPTQRGEDGRPIPDRYDGMFTWAETQLNQARAHKIKLDAPTFGKGIDAPEVTHSRPRGAYGPGQRGYGQVYGGGFPEVPFLP